MSVLKFLVSESEVVDHKGPFLTCEVTKLFVWVDNQSYTLTPGADGNLEVVASEDEDTGITPSIVLRPRRDGVEIGQE